MWVFFKENLFDWQKRKKKRQGEKKNTCTKRGRDSWVSRVLDWKARCDAEVGSSLLCGEELFSHQSTFSALSLQPLCATACLNICLHVKNPQHWQPYHCFENTAHAISLGMGSAALVAAVPYPGNETQISCKGQRRTKVSFSFHWRTLCRISLVDFILNLENNVSDS